MELLCPKCAGTNKPGTKPMICLEPDGRYSCAYCGNLFRPPPDEGNQP